MTSNEMKFETVDQLVREAESTLRKSLGSLEEWGQQARDIVADKPNAILGAAGISGFIAGALLRRSLNAKRSGKDREQVMDPGILVVGGMVAGMIVGPKLVEQALAALERFAHTEDSEGAEGTDGAEGVQRTEEPEDSIYLRNARSSQLYATGSGNEKPFEKY